MLSLQILGNVGRYIVVTLRVFNKCVSPTWSERIGRETCSILEDLIFEVMKQLEQLQWLHRSVGRASHR